MGASGAVVDVDGVITIEIRVLRNTERVPAPEGPNKSLATIIGVEAEGVRVLSESIYIGGLGEGGLQTEVLVFEDEGMTLGGEKDLVGLRARDGEREGVGSGGV